MLCLIAITRQKQLILFSITPTAEDQKTQRTINHIVLEFLILLQSKLLEFQCQWNFCPLFILLREINMEKDRSAGKIKIQLALYCKRKGDPDI